VVPIITIKLQGFQLKIQRLWVLCIRWNMWSKLYFVQKPEYFIAQALMWV
jgi:hypothetical protein